MYKVRKLAQAYQLHSNVDPKFGTLASISIFYLLRHIVIFPLTDVA